MDYDCLSKRTDCFTSFRLVIHAVTVLLVNVRGLSYKASGINCCNPGSPTTLHLSHFHDLHQQCDCDLITLAWRTRLTAEDNLPFFVVIFTYW